MINDKIEFKILSNKELNKIAVLGQQLNSKLTLDEIQSCLHQMFSQQNYMCFGAYLNDELVGVSSGWTTVRFYSGKQLEVDNVIIDASVQSKGIGKQFFHYIENWAKENDYKTIELNTYVQNSRSHKFYFNLGFSILGFHFWKKI